MLVTEGLADGDRVAAAQLAQNAFRGSSRQEIGTVLNARVVKVDSRQSSGFALVADFVGAQALDGSDAGDLGESIAEIG